MNTCPKASCAATHSQPSRLLSAPLHQVYLITSFAEGSTGAHVPSVAGLHSKLWKRCFPRSSNVLRCAQAVLGPVFKEQDSDAALQRAMNAHPFSAESLREAFSLHGASASPKVSTEVRERLETIAQADAQLRAVVRSAAAAAAVAAAAVAAATTSLEAVKTGKMGKKALAQAAAEATKVEEAKAAATQACYQANETVDEALSTHCDNASAAVIVQAKALRKQLETGDPGDCSRLHNKQMDANETLRAVDAYLEALVEKGMEDVEMQKVPESSSATGLSGLMSRWSMSSKVRPSK